MPRQFKAARQMNHLKATEAAQRLQVAQPTLSAWEGERKSPNLESLEKMADLYSVTTDFLLGRTDHFEPESLSPISEKVLSILNGKPVWSDKFGWMLVNSEGRMLILTDGSAISFHDAGDVFMKPSLCAESDIPLPSPLDRNELKPDLRIWVEPISKDADLRAELRGWYLVRERFIENDSGNRFAIDTYEAKWLAFESK